MKRIKQKLLAHKIITGISVLLLFLIVGVIAAAYTSSSDSPTAYTSSSDSPTNVFEGDCVNCDLSTEKRIVEEISEIGPKLGVFPGPDMYSDYFNFNGFEMRAVNVEFNEASSTIFNVLNPTAQASSTPALGYSEAVGGSTTTLSFFVFDQFGAATTTHTLTCGTSTTPYIDANTTPSGVLTATVATSTSPYYVMGENGIGAETAATTNNYSRIVVDPDEWFGCVATGGSSDTLLEGITGNSNTFDGRALLIFDRISY